MLTICIPIYNRSVITLVKALSDQCESIKISYEIICLDDASKKSIKDKNQEINGWFNVNYVELSENIGRSKIRNRLAKLARYDWVLFLDSDIKIGDTKFISHYISTIAHNSADVICGGVSYNKKRPKNVNKALHWAYGSHRESRPSNERKKSPIRHFHSSNFLIKREVILSTPFDEKIETYGYEDFELGNRLFEKDLRIDHIDNPVFHLGLKNSKVFLTEHLDALHNLRAIVKASPSITTPLIRASGILNKFGMINLFTKMIAMFEVRILKNLYSQKPNLNLFDLYKLYSYLAHTK